VMPAGTDSPHQRAYETGERVIDGIKTAMAGHHVGEDCLLNTTQTEGEPMVVEGFEDLTMWKNKGFVKALLDKYGDTKKFWEAYETDDPEMKALRSKFGVEGPSGIAIRVRRALTNLVQNTVREYHDKDPDALVYVWTVGQYDNITPFVRGYIGQHEPYYIEQGSDPSMWYLPADKGGGLTLELCEDGTVKTTLGKKEFVVPLLFKKPDEKTK
ncbi:MAG: hypothetical protein Q8N98_01015, partial [bacterium]|nr:hypothetical protein [bacterium]